MKTTQRKSIALLVAVAAVAALIVMPRLGGAQATPSASPVAADPAVMEMGEQIYTSVCLACHQPGGVGVEGAFPALAGNPFVTLEDPRPVVQTVLNGRGGMPRFAGSYSDEEIAAIVTYIRQAFGNQAAPVGPEVVAEVRAEFDVPSPPDASPIPSPPPGASPAAEA